MIEEGAEFTGGGQIGKVFSSWPFVKLTVAADALRLSTGVQQVTLPRASVERVRFKKRLLASEFRIEHHAAGQNPHVEFWSFSPRAVLDALQGQGYEIAT